MNAWAKILGNRTVTRTHTPKSTKSLWSPSAHSDSQLLQSYPFYHLPVANSWRWWSLVSKPDFSRSSTPYPTLPDSQDTPWGNLLASSFHSKGSGPPQYLRTGTALPTPCFLLTGSKRFAFVNVSSSLGSTGPPELSFDSWKLGH